MPRLRPVFRIWLPLAVMCLALFQGWRLLLGGELGFDFPGAADAGSRDAAALDSPARVPDNPKVPRKAADAGGAVVDWVGKPHDADGTLSGGARKPEGRQQPDPAGEMTEAELALRSAESGQKLPPQGHDMAALGPKPEVEDGPAPEPDKRASDTDDGQSLSEEEAAAKDEAKTGDELPAPKGPQMAINEPETPIDAGELAVTTTTNAPVPTTKQRRRRKKKTRTKTALVEAALASSPSGPASDGKHADQTALSSRGWTNLDTCLFPNVAVAIKTGRAVAHRRLPSVLESYAHVLCNVIFVSDSNGRLNETQLRTEFAGKIEIVEGEAGNALTGTGKKDFLIRYGGKEYPVYDVVGKLYSDNPDLKTDPDADPVKVSPLNVLHRDRWKQEEWDRLEFLANSLAANFSTKMRAERKTEREKKEAEKAKESGESAARTRRRRLVKRGEGGDWHGWSTDAEKNLPSFVELWNRFPDAEWFYMVDDDTYPFIPALYMHAKEFYKADEMHYQGKAFLFSGCHFEARPDDTWKEIDFASGGAGIIMSRGAMMKSLPYVQLGVEKTKGCWAGDARVGIWVYDPGMRLEWPWEMGGRMHVGPQGPWHSFGRACDPALTYHLVPPELFARLWEVQKQPESGGGFVTNADLFHLVFDNKSQELIDLEGGLEMDTNRGGFDFLELSRASHKMAEQEFDRKSIEELDMLLKSDFKLPWLTAKLLKKLDPIMEKITKETHVKKKAALALRCLAACQALDRVMDIPQVGKDEPIAMFHNRTAGTQNPLGNKSTKFGPCVMWSLNLADRCYLKSGLGQAPIGGAEGHWSGIVEGAYERYASLGRNQAAGERCGWAENRGEGWDRKK